MDDHNESLGAAIENAAEFLPDGYVVMIGIEKGGYSVNLLKDGVEPANFGGTSIIDEIEMAVAHAVDMEQP